MTGYIHYGTSTCKRGEVAALTLKTWNRWKVVRSSFSTKGT